MLEAIVSFGNRGHNWRDNGKVTCADGFTLSVIAGGGTYCFPRPALCFHTGDFESVHEPDGRFDHVVHDYPGPFEEVEVGFPSIRPEPWSEWHIYADDEGDPTEIVYGRVPVSLVRALVELHGGERLNGTLKF